MLPKIDLTSFQELWAHPVDDGDLRILADDPDLLVIRTQRSWVLCIFLVIWGLGASLSIIVSVFLFPMMWSAPVFSDGVQAKMAGWFILLFIGLCVLPFAILGPRVLYVAVAVLLSDMQRTTTFRAGSERVAQRQSGVFGWRARTITLADASARLSVIASETDEGKPTLLHLLEFRVAPDAAIRSLSLGKAAPDLSRRIAARIGALLPLGPATAAPAP